jgi:hypothetical protein
VVAPLVNYVSTFHRQRPDLTLTVTVPEVVDRHWLHETLHEHVAERLQRTLRTLPGVVVTSVPFQLAPRTEAKVPVTGNHEGRRCLFVRPRGMTKDLHQWPHRPHGLDARRG